MISNNFSTKTKNMVYSYSRLNSYNICPLSFKLTYIDKKERKQNAFASYGLLIHEILERFLRGEIKADNLLKYYENNYAYYLIYDFPPYPSNMENTYKNEGYDFFKNFNFALDKFDILIIEDMIEYQYKNIDLVVKPDAVIREKETGKNILLDYKTSKLYNNSYDNKKIDGYLIQTALYSYIIWLAKDLAIDEIWIWFIRNQKIKKFEFTDDLVFEMTNWLETTYQKIQEDREWKANNTKKNKYFCKNICGVRQSCPYLKW